MKRILLLLWVLGLAVLPLSAQTLKKTFTGTLECMRYIPAYEDGKVFYVNPHAGGQSGNLVVLKEADGQYRVWDNAARMWVTESLENVKCIFFLNPDVLYLAHQDDRNDAFYVGILDGFDDDDYVLSYTDWRFHRNAQGQLDYLLIAIGDKWAVVGPDCEFLLPFRYSTPQEALEAIPARLSARKPLGMSDVEYMVSQLRQIQPYELHIDWSYYDAASDVRYFTIKELPWAGPFSQFGFDGAPEPLPEDAVLEDGPHFVGVKNGVLTHVQSPYYFTGKMFPLTSDFLSLLCGDCIPVPDSEGDYLYGNLIGLEGNPYLPWAVKALRINKDGSFQLGYFRLDSHRDGSYTIDPNYICAPGDWYLDDFDTHYWTSERNKGNNPEHDQSLPAFRQQVCKFWCDDHYYVGYDSKAGVLNLQFNPFCTVSIPCSKSKAMMFIEDYNSYDLDDFVNQFERKVSDCGDVYIDNLYLKSPRGVELKYKAKEPECEMEVLAQ